MTGQYDKGFSTFTGKDSLFDCFTTYQTQYNYITKITKLLVKMDTRKEINWVEGVYWEKDTFQRHLELILEYILQKQLVKKDQRGNLSK